MLQNRSHFRYWRQQYHAGELFDWRGLGFERGLTFRTWAESGGCHMLPVPSANSWKAKNRQDWTHGPSCWRGSGGRLGYGSCEREIGDTCCRDVGFRLSCWGSQARSVSCFRSEGSRVLWSFVGFERASRSVAEFIERKWLPSMAVTKDGHSPKPIPLEPSKAKKELARASSQAVMIFSDVILDADAQLLGLGMTAWLRSQRWQRRSALEVMEIFQQEGEKGRWGGSKIHSLSVLYTENIQEIQEYTTIESLVFCSNGEGTLHDAKHGAYWTCCFFLTSIRIIRLCIFSWVLAIFINFSGSDLRGRSLLIEWLSEPQLTKWRIYTPRKFNIDTQNCLI